MEGLAGSIQHGDLGGLGEDVHMELGQHQCALGQHEDHSNQVEELVAVCSPSSDLGVGYLANGEEQNRRRES